MRRRACLLLLAGLLGAGSVGAAEDDPIDPGLYAMVDEAGELTGKVMRIARGGKDWTFEDRQPDGSWLDVSCHGGCEHPEATPEQIEAMFGSTPPEAFNVRCVINAEYGFCRANRGGDNAYSLVVRVPTPEGRLVVTMVRMPEEGESSAPPPVEFF